MKNYSKIFTFSAVNPLMGKGNVKNSGGPNSCAPFSYIDEKDKGTYDKDVSEHDKELVLGTQYEIRCEKGKPEYFLTRLYEKGKVEVKIPAPFAIKMFADIQTSKAKTTKVAKEPPQYSAETITVAKVLFAETGAKKGHQKDIADIIANRAARGKKSAYEIVTAKHQFSCVGDKSNTNWSPLTDTSAIKDWIESRRTIKNKKGEVTASVSEARITEMLGVWEDCLKLADQLQKGTYKPKNNKIIFFASNTYIASRKAKAAKEGKAYEPGESLFGLKKKLIPSHSSGGHTYFALAPEPPKKGALASK